jgi:hypothetical protein
MNEMLPTQFRPVDVVQRRPRGLERITLRNRRVARLLSTMASAKHDSQPPPQP